MSTQPTPRAWEADVYWKRVVSVITGGKRLRPEHYLEALTAEELDQLRSALSCSGSYADIQKLCPPRRGGATDGNPPSITVLCEVAKAVRQAEVLWAMDGQKVVEAAAKDRCRELGLDPTLTNAVVRIVGEEALVQQARQQVGPFAVSAAQVLLAAESARTKARQEDVKIGLRQRAEERMSLKLKLEMDRRLDAACEKLLDSATRAQADEINASSMSQADKIKAMRQEYFKDVDELMASGKVVLPD